MTEISAESLRCTITDGLARVVLSRPDIGNPIDAAFCRDLGKLSIDLSSRNDVRVVLFTAEGRFYSVGGDIRTFTKELDDLPRLVKAWTSDFHTGVARLQRMNAPIVCAIHGDVAGGGVGFAAMADVVIAAEGVKFNAAFAMLGFCADSGSTISLSNRMGLSRAKRFLLLSEVLDASAAKEAGLVDFVVPVETLSSRAEEIANKFASGPTLAYGAIKRTIGSARTETLETQLENEAQALSWLSGTDDAREGLTAFAERRKPQFKGR